MFDLQLDLPTIWFVLVGVLLAGYAVLDGFDLGSGMLHFVVGRTAAERGRVMASIGPVWDGNEVWLLTMGGALFAAFPLVYATVFSGFYLALMLLLLALIVRAVSLEFRGHVDSPAWQKVWDVAFSVASGLVALLLGVAIGNVALGLPLNADGWYAGGLMGLLNPFAILVGLMALAMFALHGAAWLTTSLDEPMRTRALRVARLAWPLFVLLWLIVTGLSFVQAPHLVENFGSPLAWLVPVTFVLAMAATALTLRRGGAPLLVASGASIATLIGILGVSLYPNLVPDASGGAGLTVANAASSDLTLTVMLIIALIGMPLVLGYTAFIYRQFWGHARTPSAG